MSKLSMEERAELARRARAYADSITDEEDAALTAAALSDPDAQPLPEGATRAFLIDVDPEFVERMRRLRGTQRAPTKRPVSMRLDHDVLDHFRATGPGWQGRVNAILRKAAGL